MSTTCSQPSSPCPYNAICATPDTCAERRSCVLGVQAPGRIYLLSQAAYPYPLRRDHAPRAVWPEGLAS